DRASPSLRIVANYSVGVNNIDLEAARARGVLVANTPDVLPRPPAELAVTLMLALLRRVAEGDRLIRRREPWGFSLEFMLGESLDGKLVGIVGPGRIGRETARLVEAFGARTMFAGTDDDLGALIAAADVVTLHCPLTPETHHLIDAAALAAMRPSAARIGTMPGWAPRGIVARSLWGRGLGSGLWRTGSGLPICSWRWRSVSSSGLHCGRRPASSRRRDRAAGASDAAARQCGVRA